MTGNNARILKIKILLILSCFYNFNLFPLSKALSIAKVTVQTVPLNFAQLRSKEKVYIICLTTGKFLVTQQILSGNVLIAIKISKIVYDLATSDNFLETLKETAIDEVTLGLVRTLGNKSKQLVDTNKADCLKKLSETEKLKINNEIEAIYKQIIKRQIDVNNKKSSSLSELDIENLIEKSSKNNPVFNEALDLAKEVVIKLLSEALKFDENGLAARVRLNSIVLPGVAGKILDDIISKLNRIYFYPTGVPNIIGGHSKQDQIFIKQHIKNRIMHFHKYCLSAKREHSTKLLQSLYTHGVNVDFFKLDSEYTDYVELIKKSSSQSSKDSQTILQNPLAAGFARLVTICQKDSYETLDQKRADAIEATSIVKQAVLAFDTNYSFQIFNYYSQYSDFLMSDTLERPQSILFENIINQSMDESVQAGYIIKSDVHSSKIINPLNNILVKKGKGLPILKKFEIPIELFNSQNSAATFESKQQVKEDNQKSDDKNGSVTKTKISSDGLLHSSNKANLLKKINLSKLLFDQNIKKLKITTTETQKEPQPEDLLLQNYQSKLKNHNFEKEYYHKLIETTQAIVTINDGVFDNMPTDQKASLIHAAEDYYSKDYSDRVYVTPEVEKVFEKIKTLSQSKKAEILYRGAAFNAQDIINTINYLPDNLSKITALQAANKLKDLGVKSAESTISTIQDFVKEVITLKIVKNSTIGALNDLIHLIGNAGMFGYYTIKKQLYSLTPEQQYADARNLYAASNFVAKIVTDPTEIGNLVGPVAKSLFTKKVTNKFIGQLNVPAENPVTKKTDLFLQDHKLFKSFKLKGLKDLDSANLISKLYNKNYGLTSSGTLTLPIVPFYEFLNKFDFKSIISNVPKKDLSQIVRFLCNSYMLSSVTQSNLPISIIDNGTDKKITVLDSIFQEEIQKTELQTELLAQCRTNHLLFQNKVDQSLLNIASNKKINFNICDYSFNTAIYYNKIIPSYPTFINNCIVKPKSGFDFVEFELAGKENIVPSIINFIFDIHKAQKNVGKLHKAFLEQEAEIINDSVLLAQHLKAKQYAVYWLNQAASELGHPQRITAIIKLNQFNLAGKAHLPYMALLEKINGIFFTSEGIIKAPKDIDYNCRIKLSQSIADFYKIIADNKEQYLNMLQAGVDAGALNFTLINDKEQNIDFNKIEDSVTWQEVFNNFLHGNKCYQISEKILNNEANAKIIALVNCLSINHLGINTNGIEAWCKANELYREIKLSKDQKIVNSKQEYIAQNILFHYARERFIVLFPIMKEFEFDPAWHNLTSEKKAEISSDLTLLTNKHHELAIRYHKLQYLKTLFNIKDDSYNQLFYQSLDSVDMHYKFASNKFDSDLVINLDINKFLSHILPFGQTKNATAKAKLYEAFFTTDGLLKQAHEELSRASIVLPPCPDWENTQYLQNINNLVFSKYNGLADKARIEKALRYYYAATATKDIQTATIYNELGSLVERKKSYCFEKGHFFVRAYSNGPQELAFKDLLTSVAKITKELDLDVTKERKVKLEYSISLSNMALANIDQNNIEIANNIISNINKILVKDIEDIESLKALTNIYNNFGFTSSSFEADSLINHLAATELNKVKLIRLNYVYLKSKIAHIDVEASYDSYVNDDQKLLHDQLKVVSKYACKFLDSAIKKQSSINNSFAILADLLSRECALINNINKTGDVIKARKLFNSTIIKFGIISNASFKVQWLEEVLHFANDSSSSSINKQSIANLNNYQIFMPEDPNEDEESKAARIQEEIELTFQHKKEVETLIAHMEQYSKTLVYKESFAQYGIDELAFKKIIAEICMMVKNPTGAFYLLEQIEEGLKFKGSVVPLGLKAPLKFDVVHALLMERYTDGSIKGFHIDFCKFMEEHGRMKCIYKNLHPNGYYYAEFKCPVTQNIKRSTLFSSEANVTSHLKKAEELLSKVDFRGRTVRGDGICMVEIDLGEQYKFFATVNVNTSTVTTWYVKHPLLNNLNKMKK